MTCQHAGDYYRLAVEEPTANANLRSILPSSVTLWGCAAFQRKGDPFIAKPNAKATIYTPG